MTSLGQLSGSIQQYRYSQQCCPLLKLTAFGGRQLGTLSSLRGRSQCTGWRSENRAQECSGICRIFGATLWIPGRSGYTGKGTSSNSREARLSLLPRNCHSNLVWSHSKWAYLFDYELIHYSFQENKNAYSAIFFLTDS